MPIRQMMNQTIMVYPVIAATGYEEIPQMGEPYEAAARVEYTPARSLTETGSGVTAYATIYTEARIRVQDEIILPDGARRAVLTAAQVHDMGGAYHHCEVTV